MITVCPSDEELLAVASGEAASSELQSHLQECDRCNRKVSGLRLEVKELQKIFASTEKEANPSPQPAAGRPPSAPPTPAAADLKKIGKYLVVGTLGGGGQANVYRAVHPTLDEQVVLKLSSRKLDDGDSAVNDRLISEGRILCQLKHPHVGRVFDLDFYEHRPFLVMEYVRGRSLDQYIRDRRMTWREIGILTAKVARALDAAHRFGIVHQDVKPQNIVIDENDEPKLIDFGMARLNGAWSDEKSQPLGGTINFMAPEQARSDTKSITGRSDVFALGAVLYYLSTGKPPFAGATRDESLSRARDCQFDQELLEKSGAPLKLRQIVLKAMCAAPAERFATAGEMAEALESLERANRRKRMMVRAIPLAALLITAGVTWGLWPQAVAMPPTGQLLITPDGQSKLDGNLPLVTGVNLKFEGLVPRNWPTAVFWVGSSGVVYPMSVSQFHGADKFDHVYIGDKNGMIPLKGSAGTEFWLMVAGRDLGDPQKVEALKSQIQSFFGNHALAELPPTGAVLLDPTGAHAEFLDAGEKSRDPGTETPDSCASVSAPLDNLSKQLKDQGYFFAGIAVPHEDASN